MMRKRVYVSKGGDYPQKKQRVELAKLKRQVARLKPELKIFPSALAFTNVPAAGSIGYVSAIVQGSNETDRDGNQIRPQWADIIIQCTSGLPGPNVASQYLNYAAYFIKDSQSSGVIPTISGTAQSIFVGATPYTGLVQYNTKDRFKVLKEWHWNNNQLHNGTQPCLVRSRVRLGGVTDYHDTTAGQASAGKNAYYIVILTSDANGVVDFDSFVHFAYTDV